MDFRQGLHRHDGEGSRKDLAEFKEEASSGSDPDVKKFADDTQKWFRSIWTLRKRSKAS
jgi:hypothetical protein